MRGFAVAVAAFAAVAAERDFLDGATDWATHPDRTADWYEEHGEPLPDLAPTITTVEANKSYVVKLECLGCPFRVRKRFETLETWQEPPQDNSILLAFEVNDYDSSLLLNSDPIAPLAPMPLEITAYQTPANLSKWTMGKMTSMAMFDKTWTLGTKWGQFQLEYEHAFVGTRAPGQTWIQFDVTGLHMKYGRNTGSYKMDKEGQKMVQLLLHEEANSTALHIADIQVIERKDRVEPFRMDCGRLAMIRTYFNPMEWDYYGKFGTVTRAWHMLLWKTGHFFEANGLVLIIFGILVGIPAALIRRRTKQEQQKIIVVVDEEAETALLAPERDDAPPEYEDVAAHGDQEVKS